MVKVVGDTSLIPCSVINWGLTLVFCIHWISDMSFFHLTAKFRRFLPPFLFFLTFSEMYCFCFSTFWIVLIFSTSIPKSLIIDLFPFAKLLKLLGINHSLSESRDIFVFGYWSSLSLSLCLSLSVSGCFTTCMSAHFPVVELDNVIRFSTLSRFSQGSCGIVPNGPTGSSFPSMYVGVWSISM